MGKPVNDLTGKRYGRLVIIGRAERPPGAKWTDAAWIAKCDCGEERLIRAQSLALGRTNSCGCLKREIASDRQRTHGKSGSPEWHIWNLMRRRCSDAAIGHDRKDYYEKGIRVCNRWLGRDGFSNFLEDMGKRPSKQHSIDRYPNNEGNYEPGNCRWATWREQARNKTNNRIIEAFGIRLLLCEWVERSGFSDSLIRRRIETGWTPEDALTVRPGSRAKRKAGTARSSSTDTSHSAGTTRSPKECR